MRWRLVVLPFMGLLAARGAQAEVSANDAATAKALFEQGRRLVSEGKAPEACPKFEASLKLDPGMGTRFNLADCLDRTGRTASAWSMYRDVAAQARATGQADRETLARERVAAIEPRLNRVTILVGAAADVPGVMVRRDESDVPKPAWGTALPVDSGDHLVTVTAPGHQRFSRRFTVSGEGTSQTIEIAHLDRETASPGRVPVPPQPPAADYGSPLLRTAGLAVGALGLVGLGLGGYFGAAAMQRRSDSEGDCDGNICGRAGKQARDDAIASANRSTIGFVAGAFLVGTGVTLYALGRPSHRKEPASRDAMTAVSFGPAGISLSGAF